MLPIALALAQFAPMLAGMLGGPKAADVATKAVAVAQAVTGQGTPDAALAAIQANPELAMAFQTKLVESHVELANIAADVEKAQIAGSVQNAGDINKTMQAEAGAEHWPTYTWRPFIGFAVGCNTFAAGVLVLIVFGPVMFGSAPAAAALASLPTALGALAAINATVLPILGIASWFRGKMQADPTIDTVNRG